jgi:hypothetical protein
MKAPFKNHIASLINMLNTASVKDIPITLEPFVALIAREPPVSNMHTLGQFR